MAIIRRKTKKRIGKQLKKIVKKHGPEAALDAATALVTTIINEATDKPAKKKDKGKKDKTDKKGSKGSSSKDGSTKGGGTKGSGKKSADKKSKKAEPEG